MRKFLLLITILTLILNGCSKQEIHTSLTCTIEISDNGIIANNKPATFTAIIDGEYKDIISVDFYIDGILQKSIFMPPFSYENIFQDLDTGLHKVNIIINCTDGSLIKAESHFTFIVKLGDWYQGGMVVYISEDGLSGIIAARNDLEGKYKWGNTDNIYDAYSPNDGYANTQKFINEQNKEFAAVACLNYSDGNYNDWYLPSIEEFQYIHNFENELIIPRSNNIYWTSTQIDASHAKVDYFGRVAFTMDDLIIDKNRHYVRPFRRFGSIPN